MDSNDPIEKRYIFLANAVAFAAHIRRPNDHQLKAVASSSLPVTGGLAEASSGPQDYNEYISFASASTRASGDFADTRRAADFANGNHGDNDLSTLTFVETQVNSFKISTKLDGPPPAAGKPLTFSVDQLHLRLESSSDRHTQTAFRGLEAEFKTVTFNGQELLVSTAPEVCTQYETYDKLVAAYQEDARFRKQFGSLFYPMGNEKTGVTALLSKPTIPNAHGRVVGTIVTGLKWAGKPPEGTEITGNRLKIDGIGSIYFGEIIFEPYSRRLTLLRLQLGSINGGGGAACEGHTGGQSIPP
jgi:hypothetical protein